MGSAVQRVRSAGSATSGSVGTSGSAGTSGSGRRRWTAAIVATALASIALATVPVVFPGTSSGAGEATLDGFDRFVRADGTFDFPGESFRDGLVHLGSWFVPEGDAAGFHHVYTQPEALAAYRETGAFPDGTVLVKELRSHRRADYTTGTNVASATGPTQWFLMVKDAGGRAAQGPLWKEGWGWALFKADRPAVNVAESFERDCQGCHLPARATDWVYVDGYPRLAPR